MKSINGISNSIMNIIIKATTKVEFGSMEFPISDTKFFKGEVRLGDRVLRYLSTIWGFEIFIEKDLLTKSIYIGKDDWSMYKRDGWGFDDTMYLLEFVDELRLSNEKLTNKK